MENFNSMDEVNERYSEWTHAILNDSQATARARENIAEQLYSIDPAYLADMTYLPVTVFVVLIHELDENANEAIYHLVKGTCGVENLADDLIKLNGRGLYIADYDGFEHEIRVNGKQFFVYKVG